MLEFYGIKEDEWLVTGSAEKLIAALEREVGKLLKPAAHILGMPVYVNSFIPENRAYLVSHGQIFEIDLDKGGDS